MRQILFLSILFAIPMRTLASDGPLESAKVIQTFLKAHCLKCHSDEKPRGKVSLEKLTTVTKENAKLWQRALTQLALGEMPPDGRPRPKLSEREAVLGWIVHSLTKVGVDPKLPGGALPEAGNLIDHERLFSGQFNGPASSPPRFWRKSQPQYDALMERLWIIPRLRYEKAHTRRDAKWAGYGYSRPFPSLDPERFTNYSGSVHADEATLRALMDAGGQIAERLTSEKPAYDKFLQPPIAVGVPSVRKTSSFRRFLIDPPSPPKEYAPFMAKRTTTQEQQQNAIRRTFQLILSRKPLSEEMKRYHGLLQRMIKKSGELAALRGLITAVIVSPEFVFRMEVGMGPKDKFGRRMLSSQELVYAISYALTDAGPDEKLLASARDGKLKTRTDVEREVRRILADSTVEKNRRLRFFQEFFGYPRAMEIFKDKPGWKHEVQYLIRDADLLVEHVLKKDRNVFTELLTIDKYFVAYPVIKDPKLFEAVIQRTREGVIEKIKKIKARGREIKPDRRRYYNRAWAYLQGLELIPRTVHGDRASAETSYIRVYGIDGNKFSWTTNQPIAVPGRRAGILTHPAWLVAHSTNFDNDIVRRGRWIREHLLAGTIPDVPIDVEAQVPDEPEHTLRHRMRVTREARCIRCHRRMDPLGLPFEMYDHYGHYRTHELVGKGKRKNKKIKVDATGEIIASGEKKLDCKVSDAIELVQKLSRSRLVRQSIIRHAFRFWMGRNEKLSDSPTLLAADNAYVKSNGSFTEMLVSLLTSDSFLYRK